MDRLAWTVIAEHGDGFVSWECGLCSRVETIPPGVDPNECEWVCSSCDLKRFRPMTSEKYLDTSRDLPLRFIGGHKHGWQKVPSVEEACTCWYPLEVPAQPFFKMSHDALLRIVRYRLQFVRHACGCEEVVYLLESW